MLEHGPRQAVVTLHHLSSCWTLLRQYLPSWPDATWPELAHTLLVTVLLAGPLPDARAWASPSCRHSSPSVQLLNITAPVPAKLTWTGAQLQLPEMEMPPVDVPPAAGGHASAVPASAGGYDPPPAASEQSMPLLLTAGQPAELPAWL